MLRKIVIGLGVVIVLLVAAVIVVPLLIPAETYKEQITKQVQAVTGRRLTIKGDASVSVFPRIAIQVNDVSFSNAKGAREAQMVTLSRLDVQLKLLPLLTGRVEIDSFVLVDPIIHLEVARDGTPNWRFQSVAAPKAKTARPAPGGRPAAKGGGGFGLRDLRLGEVRLQNGSITYTDQRSGRRTALTGLNVSIELRRFDAPLRVDGRVIWNKEQIALGLRVANPRDLVAGTRSAVTVDLKSKPVTLSFKGKLAAGGPLAGSGIVDLDVPSVRGLATWTGNPLPPGGGVGPLKIKGNLAIKGSKMTFSEAQLAFDDIKGKGTISVDSGGRVPYIGAKLDVDRLNLNPYLPPETGASGGSAKSTGAAVPATRKKSGGGKATAWSDAKIDLSALRAVNADLAFSSGEILIRKIRIEQGAIKVALRGGRMVLDLTKLKLYGGQGGGRVVIDASGKTLSIDKKLTVANVQARPLLKDATGSDWLAGTGSFSLAVTGRGNSERQLVSSLRGKGGFRFTDGAIYGINIAEIARLILSGGLVAVFDPKTLKAPPKTDFAELSGTYVIEKGIVRNKDLLMLSPLIRMTGAGTADMPQKTVNYRVEPKIVGTLKGQGGNRDIKGLVVPFTISGPWSNISVTPDLAGMLKSNPKAAVRNILKGVKGGAGKGGLGGLIKGLGLEKPGLQKKDAAGSGAAPKSDAGQKKKSDPLGSILKKLGQ